MHQAFFYRGEEDYLAAVGAFLRPAFEAGEPAIAILPGPRLERLRAALGADARHVRLMDMRAVGANPSCIIPTVHSFLEEHDGHRLHGVGEPIWRGRSPAEVREATRHEALINLACAGRSVRFLCPYDAEGLDAAVLADARRTHTHLLDAGGERPSADFGGHAFPPGCDEPLPAPPDGAVTVTAGPGGGPRLRAFVAAWLADAGVGASRREDLVLAVDELAANALEHGGGRGTVALWHLDGTVLCQVDDAGRIADPLAGRVRPAADALGGRGLWLVHRLCDLVETRSGAGGTTVRLHARL